MAQKHTFQGNGYDIIYLNILYIIYTYITYNINVYLQYISHPRGWEIHVYQCILRDSLLVRKVLDIHQRPGPRTVSPGRSDRCCNFLGEKSKKIMKKTGVKPPKNIILSTNQMYGFCFKALVSELDISSLGGHYTGVAIGYTYCFICFCFEVDFGRFYGKVVDSSTDS